MIPECGVEQEDEQFQNLHLSLMEQRMQARELVVVRLMRMLLEELVKED